MLDQLCGEHDKLVDIITGLSAERDIVVRRADDMEKDLVGSSSLSLAKNSLLEAYPPCFWQRLLRERESWFILAQR